MGVLLVRIGIVASFACALPFIGQVLAPPLRPQSETPPATEASTVELSTDTVDHANLYELRHRQLHNVRAVRADLVSSTARFGQLDVPIRGLDMQPGGLVALTLRSAAPDVTAVSLRFATRPEHHGRLQSYTVEIDGQETCSETTVDPGAGASRTVFVEVATRRPRVEVRVRAGWRNTFPVVLECVRSYRLPTEAELNAAPASRWRMGLTLLSSKGLGFAMDGDEIRRLRSLLPVSARFEPQTAVLYNFCTKDYATQVLAMRRYAELAREVRIPLRVLPQMHWAGIPVGVPDGAGGTFTDVPYQQITWDANDQTHEPGLRPLLGDRYDVRFGLSVPNRWNNTPWLTFNHPRLNQYRRLRLKEALRAWLLARDRLVRVGLAYLFPPELSTGEETVYWAKGVDDSAYTAYNGGKPRTALLADFNPFVVADALADGIILDPSNGLDGRERWWLHQNLSRWQQTIVDWMLEAVPPDPIRSTSSGPVFAEDLIRRNIYTEPYAMPVFPMRGVNPRRPGLEVGYVRDGRSGGEYWSGADMLPWLVKERERGRIALPNLECAGCDDGQLKACLLAAYACGARYATLYNWHHRPHIETLLREAVATVEREASRLVAEPSKAAPNREHDGERIFVAGPDAFAVNVLTAVVPTARDGRMPVRLSIRTLGEAPERSASVIAFVEAEGEPPYRVVAKLPAPFSVKPGGRYVLSAEPAVSGSEKPRHDLRHLRPFEAFMNCRLERWRSYAVADWQDAEDLLASLQMKAKEPYVNPHALQRLELSRSLLQRGRPVSAYRAGIRAEQLLHPCTFIVQPPGGRLSPFPIRLSFTEDRVKATVLTASADLAAISLLSGVAQEVTVEYLGRRTQVVLSSERPAHVMLEMR